MGITRSYACTTQAALTRLGSNVRRTSRGLLAWCCRRATLLSLLPWRRVLQSLPELEWGPEKPVPIAGAQLCPWNARRKLYQHVGNFVGSVVSPILANIYLHEFDEFMEQKKQEFDQGKARKITKEWRRVTVRLNRARKRALPLTGDNNPAIQAKKDRLKQTIRELDRLQKRTPAGDPLDPGYKRLFYVRYADDFLIGLIGSKQEAQQVFNEATNFLNTHLKLAISEEKSGIHHAKDGTPFLGYVVQNYTDEKL
jgi:hypothetical protein